MVIVTKTTTLWFLSIVLTGCTVVKSRFSEGRVLSDRILDASRHAAAEGDIEKATALATKSLKADPGNFHGRKQFAELLIRQNQLDEAMCEYERCSQISPRDVHTYNRLAELAIQQGNWEDARKFNAKALLFSPRGVEQRLLKARIARQQADITEALLETQALLRDEPDSCEAMLLLADINLNDRERADLAIPLLRKALRTPKCEIQAEIELLLARAYHQEGSFANSLESYAKAKQLGATLSLVDLARLTHEAPTNQSDAIQPASFEQMRILEE